MSGAVRACSAACSPFDLAVSQLMLHHVPDVEGLFASVLGHLEQGGYPAFADLAAEDGCFHDDPEEVQGT